MTRSPAESQLDEAKLETELRLALQRRELCVHYQPQLLARSGEPVAVEALLRWRHRGRWISPSVFVPAAEKAGLMKPLGGWVLQTACRQAAQWRAAGRTVRVAVNVSARQLCADFPRRVASALRLSGLPADFLELEVTEADAIVDRESALAALEAVRLTGVRLALDDFGEGYSSLSRLRSISFSTLKLDRSFILGLPGSEPAAAIVRGVVAMARELGVRVVAEGVETQAQLTFLRRVGCHQVQGYLLGRPMAAADLPEWLSTRPARRSRVN